jgi:5-hydroxyisourate hydrolase
MEQGSGAVSAVSTHVLDIARGVPAAGLPVRLERVGGDGLTEIAAARTGDDGRAGSLGPERLPPGTYRLTFDTGAYLAAQHPGKPFFPEVTVTFLIDDQAAHYHVPLLLSPFGYSTYRGS